MKKEILSDLMVRLIKENAGTIWKFKNEVHLLIGTESIEINDLEKQEIELILQEIEK